MASLSETLAAVAADDAHLKVCATSETAVQTEVPCDGGFVRVTFVPTGAADPVAVADETIATLRTAAGLKAKGDE